MNELIKQSVILELHYSRKQFNERKVYYQKRAERYREKLQKCEKDTE